LRPVTFDPHEAPPWLSERDRHEIEHVEPPAAWALSFFFGGGGQLLVHDYRKGAALLLADILAVALLPALPGFLAWLAIGTVSSIVAVRQAQAVNRYTTARILGQRAAQHAILSRAVVEPPPMTALADRADRLRKLADLRSAGVLSAIEHRERKVEILSELTGLTVSHREDLLHELLALRVQGVVDDEDVLFVKDLGA
jgi:hypothetical protein